MDEIISGLNGRPRLLLHACCAPCATHSLECVMPFFDVTLFYYNPNTYPYEEYLKRLDTLKKLSDITNIPITEGEYDDRTFYAAARGLEQLPEGGLRCAQCFRLRLERTAFTAKKLGYDMFATTLTVSPHKNAQLINTIGLEMQGSSGITYLPSDFKKRDGFKRSAELSAEYGLYRQNYCGCEFSLNNIENNKGV